MWGLPTVVEVGGENYAIRSDFRVILDIFEMLEDPDLDDPATFKVVYAGAIRRVNNLGLLVDAAKAVTDPRIKFLIWGDGDELGALRQRLADKTLKLEVTDAAKALLIDRGFDPVYGARPLKRYLQSSAETLIAKEILRGELSAGSTLVLDAENGQLACRKR